jgi:hypothetical protein
MTAAPVPEEAVTEAAGAIAAKAYTLSAAGIAFKDYASVARAALAAAAPHIRAAALLEAADERYKDGLFVFGLAARQKLRARAVTERGGE